MRWMESERPRFFLFFPGGVFLFAFEFLRGGARRFRGRERERERERREVREKGGFSLSLTGTSRRRTLSLLAGERFGRVSWASRERRGRRWSGTRQCYAAVYPMWKKNESGFCVQPPFPLAACFTYDGQ